jgi:hypothetical protein
MSILESIMGNKALVNAALGQLKNIIKKEGLEFIIIKVDPETDEIILNMYQPGECKLNITEQDQQAAISEIPGAETLSSINEQLQNKPDATNQDSPQ